MTQDSLAPTLLLAMPQMEDPNFARAVVLLCKHEREGAMGLVVNRPSATLVSSVLEVEPPLRHDNGLQIWMGGPVETERGWLLLADNPGTPETIDVSAGVFLSGSMEMLRRSIEEESSSGRARFLLGYAGWAAGQLESELAASAWLTVDVSADLIFRTDPGEMWQTAIRSLGVDPYSLQMGGGVH